MTLADAIAQRDAVLQNLGVSKSQYQGRMIEYPVGDARLKELSYLEDLIQRLTDQQNNVGSTRCTYATFNRS